MPSGSPKGSIGSNTQGNVSTGGGGTQSGGAVGTIGSDRGGRDLGRSENSAAGVARTTTADRNASYGTKSGGGFGNVDGSKSAGLKSEAAVSKEVADKAATAAKTASKSQGIKSEAAISREVSKAAEAKAATGKTASNLDRALAVARGAGTLGKAAPGTKAPSDATISSLKRDAISAVQPKTAVDKGGILGTGVILNNVPRNPLRDPSKFTPGSTLPSYKTGLVDLPGPLDPAANALHNQNISRMVEAQRLADSIMTVFSGYRPKTEAEARAIEAKTGYNINTNEEADGAKHSQHMLGSAFDVGLDGLSSADAIEALSRAGFNRVNVYPSGRMHVDEGPNRAPYSTGVKANASPAMRTHIAGGFTPDDSFDRAGLEAMSGAPTSVAAAIPTRARDPIVDAFNEVMGSDDLVSPVRATERQEQNTLSRAELADLSRVVAQPQAPSVAAVDTAAAARRGLRPAAGPIPNPPATPQVAQTPPVLHPDRRIELASRRLPSQPLVNTASASAVEEAARRDAAPPGYAGPAMAMHGLRPNQGQMQLTDAAGLGVDADVANLAAAIFGEERSRSPGIAPEQVAADYTSMGLRNPSLAGMVNENRTSVEDAQSIAEGIWGGEEAAPATAQASTGDPVLDAIRDIFGGTPPAEAASPVNRVMKQALDPYGDDPDFMSEAPNAGVRPVPSAPANVPRTPPQTFAGSGQPAQGIAAAIAALGGVVPQQSPSFAKLAPAHAPYPAPTPQPNPMRQQPDAEVASVGGRYTGTAAPRAPEAPPAPALTGIAPSLKTADASGIVGDMMSILGAPKSDAFTPSMPEEPQRSVITPKQSQPQTVDPMRAMIDRAYGDFTRGMDTPAEQATARDMMAAPSSQRGILPSPGTTTPPGIKPVAPPADMFEDGIRPQPAPKPIETPPARFVPGKPAQIATPGTPLDIDPNRQKNPYGTEEDSRPATEEQEREGTRLVTKYGPKVDKILEHKSKQFAAGGTRGGGSRDNVIRLANQIRQKSQSLANPDTVTPSEPPNSSGLTSQQIAAILQAIGAAA